jgi:hypothetical protein
MFMLILRVLILLVSLLVLLLDSAFYFLVRRRGRLPIPLHS